jgi:hypothetical protein
MIFLIDDMYQRSRRFFLFLQYSGFTNKSGFALMQIQHGTYCYAASRIYLQLFVRYQQQFRLTERR